MAHDSKYGKMEIPGVPDDEPVFVFRAKDRAVPALLHVYAAICEGLGSPRHHIEHVRAVADNMRRWQQRNKDKVKAPD